jgi:hypothetical protein
MSVIRTKTVDGKPAVLPAEHVGGGRGVEQASEPEPSDHAAADSLGQCGQVWAICPAHDRECFGCYGPSEAANLASLTGFYEARGTPRADLTRLVRSFNGYAPAFRAESDRLEGERDG